jgi:hypothetical protein
MQTLNVGAGQSENEYKQAAEQQRADLRTESLNAANFFFLAAGLAALGSGLLLIRINVIVSIGLIDLLRLYGAPLGPLYALVVYGAAFVWIIVLVGLGFAARSAQRWAFLAGMVLYAIDMIMLIMMFSLWAFGIHAFFIFMWYKGQKALQDLKQP